MSSSPNTATIKPESSIKPESQIQMPPTTTPTNTTNNNSNLNSNNTTNLPDHSNNNTNTNTSIMNHSIINAPQQQHQQLAIMQQITTQINSSSASNHNALLMANFANFVHSASNNANNNSNLLVQPSLSLPPPPPTQFPPHHLATALYQSSPFNNNNNPNNSFSSLSSSPSSSSSSSSTSSLSPPSSNHIYHPQHLNPSLNNTNQQQAPAPTLSLEEQQQQTQQLYEYMAQLLDEKEKLKELFNEPFSILLPISAKLLDEEISRIRVNLFQLGGKESVCLPEPIGTPSQQTEKLYVPVKDHPEFNFVGRILGPRGMTAKQLEQETGCKIMVRGKGSMRDKAKEDQMKGKPNWEHLNDELHVLITVEDTKNRAEIKLKRAVEEIKRLLVPAPEGEDDLKKKQLMELAIINGTYRDGSKLQQKMNQILALPGGAASLANVNVNMAGMANLVNGLGGMPMGLNMNPHQLNATAMNQLAAAFANNQQQHTDIRSPPLNHLNHHQHQHHPHHQLGGQPLIISPRLAGNPSATTPSAVHQQQQLNQLNFSIAQNNLAAVQFLNNQQQQNQQQHSNESQQNQLIYTIPPNYLDHQAFAAAAAAQAALLEGVPYPGVDYTQVVNGGNQIKQQQQRYSTSNANGNGGASNGGTNGIGPMPSSGAAANVRAHPYARVALS